MSTLDLRFEPINEQFDPVEVEKIRQLERKIKTSLPKEYVNFISCYGGCGFSGNAKVRGNGQWQSIFTFFDGEKLLAKLDIYSDLTAEGKVTFADDMYGNPFVLDTLTGQVFFIDFTVNPPIGRKVTDSFSVFLASIQVHPFE